MDLVDFADRFDRFVRGFDKVALDEVHGHSKDAVDFVREQLDSGLGGDGRLLKPTYLDDPFFNEPGKWKGRSREYMQWKGRITPPERGQRLFLPPRPADVPNLRIDGTFHGSIYAKGSARGLVVGSDSVTLGADIEQKYGSRIFRLGHKATEWMMCRVLERLYKEYDGLGLNG